MPSPTLIGHGLSEALQYQRRTPESTVLYRVLQHHLESFLASAREQGRFVERELRAFLACGILAHGFLRVRCQECGRERLVAYSCKKPRFSSRRACFVMKSVRIAARMTLNTSDICRS